MDFNDRINQLNCLQLGQAAALQVEGKLDITSSLSTACTVGCVENGNQRVFKNLLAFFADIWYID